MSIHEWPEEALFRFGREGGELGGVVTQPFGPHDVPPTGILFLNAGIIPRVGPNRLHVRLARSLAARGFLSLRFDFSGIGDSPRRGGTTPSEAMAVEETLWAMDFLARRYEIRDFVLAGICSGAVIALLVARADPRVSAAVLANLPFASQADEADPPARGGLRDDAHLRTQLRYYTRKLTDVGALRRLLTLRSDYRALVATLSGALRTRTRTKPRSAREPLSTFSDLTALDERGARCLLLFSEGSTSLDRYSIVRRLVRRPPGTPSERILTHVFSRCDHVFTPIDAQERLIRVVQEWLAPA